MQDDDTADSLIGRDHWLPTVTPEAVGEALLDFPLEPSQQITLGWMAKAIRSGLSFTMTNGRHDPRRESDALIRARLQQLANRLRTTWRDAFERDEGLDDLLFNSAFTHWHGNNALGAACDPAFEYNRLSRALAELEWLATYFERAARETKAQPKNWRLTEDREWRVARGQILAAIFERAFEQEVTVNRHRYDARFQEPTPFMIFYCKMVKLAFGNVNESNLPDVLQEARRRHLAEPWPCDE